MKKMNYNDTMMAVSTIMSITLIITSIILLLWVANSNKNKNNYDVNRDGIVDSKDMLDLRKYLIEKGK